MMTRCLWLLIVLLLAGCKSTQTSVVERVSKDTVYDIRERHDTLHLIDSVVVREWMRGDTVWIERSHRSSRERTKVVRDTVREVRIDSIPIVIGRRGGEAFSIGRQSRRASAAIVVAVVIMIVFLLILMKRNK